MEWREPARGVAIPNIPLSNATIPNVETVLFVRCVRISRGVSQDTRTSQALTSEWLTQHDAY